MNDLLAELEASKRRYGTGEEARVEALLDAARGARFTDPATLIRLHETLLFLRAYPHSPGTLRRAEDLLASFAGRVAQAEGDLTVFEEPEVSGIAGTSFTARFTYPFARHIARRYPKAVRIDWESLDNPDRFGLVLPRLLPLLADDSMVEAHVPYREWLRRAAGEDSAVLAWLLDRLTPADYDTLELFLRWDLGDCPATRTHSRFPAGETFYHREPLLRRAGISIEAEMEAPPIPVEKLSRAAGQQILDLTRDTSAVRYRELWGFSHGDPAHLWRADLGRGVAVYLFGVPPEHRLPLRAYHGAVIIKNGVPLGYFEALSLFERMEAGFNLYYTFREGESAWLYTRLLHMFRQQLGVSVFYLDPYQIGQENEEAIQAGAFWFYRKLGYRPVEPALEKLARAEERKMQAAPGHRSTARTLRRLAEAPMIYEPPGAPRGDWDRFQTRNLGFAALPKGDWASLLGRARWTGKEKEGLREIARAKSGPDETRYLRLLQRNSRLREVFLKLGSG